MIFLDGVGIGRHDPSVNPFFAVNLPALGSIPGGALPSLRRRRIHSSLGQVVPLDANLGMPGLPQSGTGQTALFTGVNASRVAGKHFGPYPYSSLRPIIAQNSIFRRLLDGGRKVCFANAFPRRYFEYVEQRPTRVTATTYACQTCGVPIRGAEELAAGRGLSADITNEGWPALGYPDLGRITPEEAGRRLARLATEFDFVLFEYWRTDHAGHSRSLEQSKDVLLKLDGLVAGVLETLQPRETLLLITSDHGNLEDLSTKTHTRNPVPAFLWGCRHEELARRLLPDSTATASLMAVTPALTGLMLGAG